MLEAFRLELENSKKEGYIPPKYDDDYDYDYEEEHEFRSEPISPPPAEETEQMEPEQMEPEQMEPEPSKETVEEKKVGGTDSFGAGIFD